MTLLSRHCTTAFVVLLGLATFSDAQEKPTQKTSNTSRKTSASTIPAAVRRAARELETAMEDDGLSYAEFRRSLGRMKTEIKLAADRNAIDPRIQMDFMLPIIQCEGIVSKWGDGDRDSPNEVWRQLDTARKEIDLFLSGK